MAEMANGRSVIIVVDELRTIDVCVCALRKDAYGKVWSTLLL